MVLFLLLMNFIAAVIVRIDQFNQQTVALIV